MFGKIDLVLGDITLLKVDAIVNAANATLLGGGGVDGAIHRAAGPRLLEECRKLKGCPTGEARITKGYLLPAKHVIHTVGPIWTGGNKDEDNLLRACYSNAMILAAKNGIRTIAFPSISTGAYGFPIDRAAKIAVTAISKFLATMKEFDRVVFVCFSKSDHDVYKRELTHIQGLQE